MKTVKPNVVTSDVSALSDLKEFMVQLGISNAGEGVTFTSAETRQLSSCLRCISPRFVEKFLPNDSTASLTCFGALISRPMGEAYAFAWARIDKLSIDVDLAILPLDGEGNPGNVISAIYEPTFDGRTTLSADTVNNFANCPKHFDVQQLSAVCPQLHEAFKYCSEA
jgi:hypothetical protein